VRRATCSSTVPSTRLSVILDPGVPAGLQPKLATVAKVMLFPTDAYALGALSNNIATDAWFTPYSPYKSSLTGQSAYKFAEAYQNAGHGQWVNSMGSTYALFEVASRV